MGNWREEAADLFEVATALYWDEESRTLGIGLPGQKAILRIRMDRVNDYSDTHAVEWGWRMSEDVKVLWIMGGEK